MIETQYRLVDLENGKIAEAVREENLNLTLPVNLTFDKFTFTDPTQTRIVHHILRFIGGRANVELNELLLRTLIVNAPNLMGNYVPHLNMSQELLLPEGDQPGLRFIHNEDGPSSLQVYKPSDSGDLVLDIPLDSDIGPCIGVGRTRQLPSNPTKFEMILKKAVILRRSGLKDPTKTPLINSPVPVANF